MSDKDALENAVKTLKQAESEKSQRVKNAVKTAEQVRQTQMGQQSQSR